ncbi:hypothetical protein DPMN_069021 [Dreissena polymorpha]|uniref:Uncharacterized protein n=1 Tax=Dreissena polymorpha TaxID=45954 RepID=A0A9D3Z3B7_DREPO|nr:hypothetical protein DPMN_069021 [Dreissena polymorpha]
MLTPRIMKLDRYIDHDWQMTPIDFQVTRSKVMITVDYVRFFIDWRNQRLTFLYKVVEGNVPAINIASSKTETHYNG